MSERRANEKRKTQKKTIDPLYYSMFIPDDESTDEIEERFKELDKRMKSNENQNPDEIARQLFKENAMPNQVPLDLWLSFQNESDVNDKDEDATFSMGGSIDEYDEEFVSRKRITGGRHKKINKPKIILIAASQQIEHLGAGVDLWPIYKVQQLDVTPYIVNIHDFPNRETFNSRNKIRDSLNQNPIHFAERITAKVVHDIVGNYCDAIIMDPPFGHNDWTAERFFKFLINLGKFLKRAFIVVWADPENFNLLQEVFEKTEYVFCDSIAIELLDEYGRPYQSKPSQLGFKRESRMAIMFRTDDIVRSDLKQQRVKDTGFGTVYENGKTYGRLGLPLSIHEILEIMLPDLPTRKRTFVELWPSFFSRRDGWIMIDEKANPEEELKDELIPDESTPQCEIHKFDNTLIDSIIDLDDKKSHRNIDKSKTDRIVEAIVIRNGTDDNEDDVDFNEIARRKAQRTQNHREVILDYSDSSDD